MEFVKVETRVTPRPLFELSTEAHADEMIAQLNKMVPTEDEKQNFREFIIRHLQSAEIRGSDNGV